MSEQVKYSLWLMPEGETYKRLSALIHRLAKSHGAPSFNPHITLLGGITSDDEDDVLRRTHLLASRLESFDIALGPVEYMDEYYRSLFIKVTPTGDLINAHVEAKLAMAEVCMPPGFYPHISLLYGHYFPMIKEAIISDIGREFHFPLRVSSIKLMRTSGGPKLWKGVGVFTLP